MYLLYSTENTDEKSQNELLQNLPHLTSEDKQTLDLAITFGELPLALPSLQDIYFKRCKSRAAKIIKDSNHPGNRLVISLPSSKRFRSMMAKTERLRRCFIPQAPKLKLSLITSTGLNLINCKNIHYSPSSALLLYVHTRYNLFAHSSCTSLFILIFIISQYTVLHILSHCTFYSLFYFIICSYFYCILTYIYIYSLVLCFIFIFFALSIERTCPDLHFTTDYTLYDCICDE